MPKRNRRNRNDFAIPAIGTSATCPIKMPAKREPVTGPRLNPPIFTPPIRYPRLIARNTASSGYLTRICSIHAMTIPPNDALGGVRVAAPPATCVHRAPAAVAPIGCQRRCRRGSALRLGGYRIRLDQLQSPRFFVTMDLLHIELAHEIDRLLRQHLARHHDRKPGG